MLYRFVQNFPQPALGRNYNDDEDVSLGPCEQSSAVFFSGHARTIGGYVTLDFSKIVCTTQPFRRASFVATPIAPDAPAVGPSPILICEINGPVVRVRSVNTNNERIDVEFSWHCHIEIGLGMPVSGGTDVQG